jgi:acyl-coenzyme A synthetase/AMP-(fatty) acid ligase
MGRDLRYFSGGRLNASYNCVDRHLENGNGSQRAIIWEGDEVPMFVCLYCCVCCC